MEKIRKHVEELFQEAPETKKVKDLKEEMIADLEEKYNDLIENGEKPQTAYRTVIAGIGDVDELIESLKEPQIKVINMEQVMKHRKKRAMVVVVSVMLYILSLVAAVILEETGMEEYIAASAFLVLAGVATCILVYHFIATPKMNYEELVSVPKTGKVTDEKTKKIKGSVSGILWLITVTVYLLISFYLDCWPISWIIFIIASVLQCIINLLFDLRD